MEMTQSSQQNWYSQLIVPRRYAEKNVELRIVVTYSLGMLSSLVAVWNLKDSNFWELQDLHLRNWEI